MEKSVFDFPAFRPYMLHKLGPKGQRNGLRQKLAGFLKVHTTLVSLVLQGKSPLSPEHAEEINEFFRHTEGEAEYFSLLVQLDRAGTPRLRSRLEEKIRRIRQERERTRSRVKGDNTLSDQSSQTYYSSALYALHHMAATLEKQHDAEALSEALRCSLERTKDILEFLVAAGLLRVQGQRYELTNLNMHIGDESPFTRSHHNNFRLLAMQRLESRRKEDLNFSSAFTLSVADAAALRRNVLAFIEQQANLIRPSAGEELFVMNFDLFRVPFGN